MRWRFKRVFALMDCASPCAWRDANGLIEVRGIRDVCLENGMLTKGKLQGFDLKHGSHAEYVTCHAQSPALRHFPSHILRPLWQPSASWLATEAQTWEWNLSHHPTLTQSSLNLAIMVHRFILHLPVPLYPLLPHPLLLLLDLERHQLAKFTRSEKHEFWTTSRSQRKAVSTSGLRPLPSTSPLNISHAEKRCLEQKARRRMPLAAGMAEFFPIWAN